MRSTSSLSGGGLSGGSLLGSGRKGSGLGGATAGAAKAEGPQFILDATYGGGLNQGERAAPWLKVRVGCEDVKRSFPPKAFPNGVWERGAFMRLEKRDDTALL